MQHTDGMDESRRGAVSPASPTSPEQPDPQGHQAPEAAETTQAPNPPPPGMPGRGLPITLIVVGALLLFPGSLLAWLAAFFLSLNSTALPEDGVGGDVPNGGFIVLEADRGYEVSVYAALGPEDAGDPTSGLPSPISCTMTAPDGTAIPVQLETPGEGSELGPGPVGAFTTDQAGEYTANCEVDAAAGDIMVAIYPNLGEDMPTGIVPVVIGVVVAVLGLAMLIVGIVLLVRVNRRRRALRAQREEIARAATIAVVGPEGLADAPGAPAEAGPPLREPAPSSDPRVVLSPENAFGHGSRSGKPPSMAPAVVMIVLGALLMVGGPVAGALAPVVAVLADPTGGMTGGTVSNGESIDLPANNEISLYFAESPDLVPETDEEWQVYTPPPVPECTVTDPAGDAVEITVESQAGFESATMTTTDSGAYTFDCAMDSRYAGTIDAWAMGSTGAGGLPTTMLVGLVVGAIGLVVLVLGIVLAVRTSGRRHDAGL